MILRMKQWHILKALESNNMGMFNKLLTDLQNNDEETIKALLDISTQVEKDKIKTTIPELEDTNYIVKEELINCYLVMYEYRYKKIKAQSNSGQSIVKCIGDIRIISIIQPLDKKIILDSVIEKDIYKKLRTIIEKY